jgi:hypothetical protein
MPAIPGFPLLQPSKYPKKSSLLYKCMGVDLKTGFLNNFPRKKI